MAVDTIDVDLGACKKRTARKRLSYGTSEIRIVLWALVAVRSSNKVYSAVCIGTLTLVAVLLALGTVYAAVYNNSPAIFVLSALYVLFCAALIYRQSQLEQKCGELQKKLVAAQSYAEAASAANWQHFKGEEELVNRIIERRDHRLLLLEQELDAAKSELGEQLRIKSDFLAHISHEIRTPLNAVVGMAELLNRSKLSAEQQELVGLITSSGETLLSVINDILDYSRIEAGQLSLSLAEFELTQLVENTAFLLAEQARLKEVMLTTFVSPTLARTYLGDESRLRQVLVNILANSIRFASKSEIFMSVGADEIDRTRIKFSIICHGSGIATSVVANLFSPITDVDMFTARKYGGIGLGLSVAKRLVELMEGEMGVECEEGKSSVFWFAVPVKQAPLAENTPEIEPSTVARQNGSAMLVGKASSLVAVILAYTRSWAIDCHYQPDAASALRSLRSAPGAYQAVIVDSSLEEEAVNLLATIFGEEEFSEIQAMLLSDTEEIEQLVKKLGVSMQMLRKPFKKAQLKEALRQCNFSVRRTGEVVRPEAQLKSFLASVDFASRPGKPGKESSAQAAEIQHSRILVVEDNPVNRRLVHLQLSQLGLTCDVVENGQEAIEALDRNDYDIVFMDCWMPVLDGYAATARIRESEAAAKKNRHTTIVAMTANAMDNDRKECIAAGMDDYISKPVTQTVLKAMLDKWVNKPNLSFDPPPNAAAS